MTLFSGVPAKFIGTYGTLLASGLLDPTTKRDFKGHVSGSDLVIDAFEPGNVDAGNLQGQVVIVKPNTGWANRVAKFIQNATGTGTPENHTVAALSATDIDVQAPFLQQVMQRLVAIFLLQVRLRLLQQP